jgi:hypothetical protein
MTGIEAFWRAVATIVIWVMMVGSFALTGVFMADALGEGVVMIVFLLLGAAVVSTGFIWNWGRVSLKNKEQGWQEWGAELQASLEGDGYSEKHKSDRISAALRNLSDDELVRLRKRIARGEITDDDLEAAFQEEGYQ